MSKRLRSLDVLKSFVVFLNRRDWVRFRYISAFMIVQGACYLVTHTRPIILGGGLDTRKQAGVAL